MPFTALPDFVGRIDLRLCNKRVVESLVAAGACDGLGGHRKQLIEALESALGEAQLLQQEREAGQASLFGEASAPRPRRHGLPDIPAWSEAERLAKEKEVIGFFISGHPLERFRDEVELFGTRTTATLGEWSEHPVNVATPLIVVTLVPPVQVRVPPPGLLPIERVIVATMPDAITLPPASVIATWTLDGKVVPMLADAGGWTTSAAIELAHDLRRKPVCESGEPRRLT